MRKLSKRAYHTPRDTLTGYYPEKTPEKMARWKAVGRLLYRIADSGMDVDKYMKMYTRKWTVPEIDQFKWWYRSTPRDDIFKRGKV